MNCLIDTKYDITCYRKRRNHSMDKKLIDVRKGVRYNVDEGDDDMIAISITKARANLYQTVSDVNEYSQPITITNNRGKNAVLIAEDDWLAIQETLYLNSIPDMAQSILASREEDLSECTTYDPDEEW